MIIKWFSKLLLLFFPAIVAWYIISNINNIVKSDFCFSTYYLFLSFPLAVASYVFMFCVWQWISASINLKLHWQHAAKFFFISQLGKYLQGNIGLFVIRLDAYKYYSREKVAIGTVIEYIVTFEAMCLTTLTGLYFVPVVLPGYFRIICLLGICTFLILLWPPLLKKVSHFVLRFLKCDPIREIPSYRNMFFFVAGNLASTLLCGLAFYFVLYSLTPIRFSPFLPVTGAFYAACIVGVITFFATGGIGVREGILFLILPLFISKSTVILSAVIIRLVMTAAELFLAFLAYMISKIVKTSHNRDGFMIR